VNDYNDAGKKFGVDVTYDHQDSNWQFRGRHGALEEAYRHRPVLPHNNPVGSPSHCGVEFVRALSEHTASQFARRLARRRFHLL
jgi:hypothetical protein